MKPTDCVKLENDKSFKREYAGRIQWWCNFLFVAPSLIMFLGLAGMLYLFKLDMLVSWYTLPFVIFFMLGTIWLKAVKRHIMKTLIEKEGAFLVCPATLYEDDGKYSFFIFSNGDKRHNAHYAKTFADSLRSSSQDIASEKDAARRSIVTLQSPDSDETFCMKAFLHKDIRRCNAAWTEKEPLPLLYVDNKNLFIIKKRDLPA